MQGILYKALEESMESLATSMQLARFKKKFCVADNPPYTALAWLTEDMLHV